MEKTVFMVIFHANNIWMKLLTNIQFFYTLVCKNVPRARTYLKNKRQRTKPKDECCIARIVTENKNRKLNDISLLPAKRVRGV